MRGVITILAFVLTACATGNAMPDQWTKPGSRSGDLAVELYVCSQWSRNPDDPSEVYEPYFRDCMTAHGWSEVASAP